MCYQIRLRTVKLAKQLVPAPLRELRVLLDDPHVVDTVCLPRRRPVERPSAAGDSRTRVSPRKRSSSEGRRERGPSCRVGRVLRTPYCFDASTKSATSCPGSLGSSRPRRPRCALIRAARTDSSVCAPKAIKVRPRLAQCAAAACRGWSSAPHRSRSSSARRCAEALKVLLCCLSVSYLAYIVRTDDGFAKFNRLPC